MRNTTSIQMSSTSLNILQLLLPDINDPVVYNEEDDMNYSNPGLMQMLSPLEFAEVITNDRWN